MVTTDMNAEKLIIGLDGGEWSVIEELVETGAMPNTARVINTGYCANLVSTTPPVSPLAWNSIYIRENPGKYSAHDFNVFKQDHSRQSVSSRDRQSAPFWQILNDHGVSTGLFKLPLCYPVDDIGGFPAPKSGTELVSPPEVNDVVGDQTALLELNQSLSDGNLWAFGNCLVPVDRSRRCMAI